jgi:sporadic carbohydrate cluster protein (TIGR04323 family)
MVTMMAEAQAGFRGYCSHQPFGGFRIPVPVQNLMLRDFAERKGLTFLLSVNEMNFRDCYIALNTLLDELPALQGMIMASLSMLPADNDARHSVFERVLAAGATIHTVLEDLTITSADDVELAEQVFLLSTTLKKCPNTISPALLPELPGFRSFTN